jgi:hypothetical protein
VETVAFARESCGVKRLRLLRRYRAAAFDIGLSRGRRYIVGRSRCLGLRFGHRLMVRHGCSVSSRCGAVCSGQRDFAFATVAAARTFLAQVVPARIFGASHANPRGGLLAACAQSLAFVALLMLHSPMRRPPAAPQMAHRSIPSLSKREHPHTRHRNILLDQNPAAMV